MRRTRLYLAIIAAAAIPAAASAQSATQTVNFNLQPIMTIQFNGAITLVVNTATAGSTTSNTATANGTWNITNNFAGGKVTAALNADMPAGMTLTTTLTPGAAGTGSGTKTLSTAETEVIATLNAASISGPAVQYSLAVPTTTAPTTGSRVVTYTIFNGS